jgi:IS4 transposase
VALIFAQLNHATGLRGLETSFNANTHHHYHLGVAGPLARTTLSDANARRPAGVFAETFAMLSKMASRQLRCEGEEMIRLIDASPIPLGKMCRWAKWNGRIRGMKMHVVYDPRADCPRRVDITPANVNDVEIGRLVEIEAGSTYVFDKGYYHYGWWTKIHAAGAQFVTRPKTNARFRVSKHRYVRKCIGDGFRIISDDEVVLASKGDSRLPMPLRRIRVKRNKGGTITIITNDMQRKAVEIAALYKERWQIDIDQAWRLSRFCCWGGVSAFDPWRGSPPMRRGRSDRFQGRNRLGIRQDQLGALGAAASVAARQSPLLNPGV